jgi:beta-glucanase (GH16 family)
MALPANHVLVWADQFNTNGLPDASKGPATPRPTRPAGTTTSGSAARAKLPGAKGTWPVIWLLGSKGQWPADGQLNHTHANPHTGHDTWPFDAPQYLILNIAIGSALLTFQFATPWKKPPWPCAGLASCEAANAFTD